jgi:hypothetical protein
MDRSVQVAVAAGLEALKDAGIVTGEGPGLDGWVLPEHFQVCDPRMRYQSLNIYESVLNVFPIRAQPELSMRHLFLHLILRSEKSLNFSQRRPWIMRLPP